ncbi:MAG: penicillin-binding protein, partial [Bacteroidota bacterium]
LGATPNIVAGAWVGADDRRVHFSTLRDGQGARTALPIWGKFMEKAQADPKFSAWKEATYPKPPYAVRKELSCPPRTNFASQSEFQRWWEEQKAREGY